MKRHLAILSILLVFALTCNLASAYSGSIDVPARDRKKVEVNLNNGDHVSGRVTLIGESINFTVSDPDGRVILSYTVSNPVDFQFTTEKAGTYCFYFENYSSDEPKFVTLNYNVQHYIFGYPQEFIILFVIVGFALIGIIVFVAMSPKP